ncbi:MAG: hypothetical protein ABFS02_08335 [Pseudomonadota bacterium]
MTNVYSGFPVSSDASTALLPFAPKLDAVKTWLDDLPIAHIQQAGRQMLGALKALNRHSLTPRERLDLAEVCRPVASYLSDGLERQFLDAPFPLESGMRAGVEMCVWLHVELMTSYKRLTDEAVFAGGGVFDSSEKAMIIHRALGSANRILLRISQVYELPFAEFWHDVYRLYLLADKHGILHWVVKDSVSELSNGLAIETMFKRLLVFQVCDPSRFRQREMQFLFKLAAQFSEFAVLQNEMPAKGGAASYALNLLADMPPRHIGQMKLRNADDRVLLTRPMGEKMFDSYKSPQARQKGKLNAADKVLLKRLIKIVGAPMMRKYARVSGHVERSLVIGVRSLINVLSGEDLTPVSEGEKEKPLDPRIAGQWEIPDYDLLPLENDFGTSFIGNFDRAVRNENIISGEILKGRLSNKPKDDGIWSKKDAAAEELRGTGEVHDSSATGYCIVWKNDQPKIKVGNVVGLQAEGEKKMEIGIIRRIAHSETGELAFGIELISPEAKVVGISVPGQEEAKALFLDGVPACELPDSVIVPPSGFEPGESVTLIKDGVEYQCRLNLLLQSTAAFKHLTIAYRE